MTSTAVKLPTGVAGLLAQVAERAKAAKVFGSVELTDQMLKCAALASAEPAEYRLLVDQGKLWVVLVTEHRWLSQSIEADLVHTGDKIDELIEEELVNLGVRNLRLTYEHFRDPQKLYTFRSPLPTDIVKASAADADAVHLTTTALLAYEAAFRPLGDMEADEDED